MEEKLNDLVTRVFSYSTSPKVEVKDELLKAYKFAEAAHSGQKRLSGESYILHLLETALILADWKMDLTTVVAGLLHDCVEDAG